MFKIQTPLNISGLKDSRTPEHLVLLEMSLLFIVLVVLLFRGLSTSTGIIELFPKQWAAIWEKTSEIYLMIIADNNQHWPFHAAFSRHTNDRVGFLNHGQFAPSLVLEVLPKADIWFLSGQRADGLPVSSLSILSLWLCLPSTPQFYLPCQSGVMPLTYTLSLSPASLLSCLHAFCTFVYKL